MFMMARENTFNLNQALLPAVYNAKDGSTSFLPLPQPRNELIMMQKLPSQTIHGPFPQAPLLPAGSSRMVQSSHLLNRSFASAPNLAQDFNLLQLQCSLSGDKMVQSFTSTIHQQQDNRSSSIQNPYLFHSKSMTQSVLKETRITEYCSLGQLSLSESNIPNKISSLDHQLPSHNPQNSYSLAHQSPQDESTISQGCCSNYYQMFPNELNVSQKFYSLDHKLSSNIPKKSCSVDHQLPPNESNISQYSIEHQLSSNQSDIPQKLLSLDHKLSSNNPKNSYSIDPPNGIVIGQRYHRLQRQMAPNESMMSQKSCSFDYQLSSNESMMSQKPSSFDHQPFPNESMISQKPSSFDYQLFPQESNIPQKSFVHQLSSKELKFIRKSIKSERSIVMSENEPRQNKVKHSFPLQQPETESNLNLGLVSTFEHTSKDRSHEPQNPSMPCLPKVGNEEKEFPELKGNLSAIHEIEAMMNLNPSRYPKYSENVNIFVVGSQHCGKLGLIRTYAENYNISKPIGKRLGKLGTLTLSGFNVDLKTNIWHADGFQDIEDLKVQYESLKSAFVLVYSILQRNSLSVAIDWIQLLKLKLSFDVPIILVENNASASFESKLCGISGAELLEKHNLAAFYQCSMEHTNDVHAIFNWAVFVAFCQKTPKPDFKDTKTSSTSV